MIRKHSRTDGYTLVEVIVAVFILTVGLVAILPMLALNLQTNLNARIYSAANFLAQEKLEKIKAWPVYEQITPSTNLYGQSDFWNESEVELSEDNVGMAFSRVTSVFHNGHTVDCDGILYDSLVGDIDDELMNTGLVVPEGANVDNPCDPGEYRGEDFKLVRVVVSWSDSFGLKDHSISRFAYIAKF